MNIYIYTNVCINVYMHIFIYIYICILSSELIWQEETRERSTVRTIHWDSQLSGGSFRSGGSCKPSNKHWQTSKGQRGTRALPDIICLPCPHVCVLCECNSQSRSLSTCFCVWHLSCFDFFSSRTLSRAICLSLCMCVNLFLSLLHLFLFPLLSASPSFPLEVHILCISVYTPSSPPFLLV